MKYFRLISCLILIAVLFMPGCQKWHQAKVEGKQEIMWLNGWAWQRVNMDKVKPVVGGGGLNCKDLVKCPEYVALKDKITILEKEIEALKNRKPGQKVVITKQTQGKVPVTLTVSAPPEATLGNNYKVVADVLAHEDVAGIVVKTNIPNNARYVKSMPNARLNGKEVVWHIDRLNKGQTKRLVLFLKPIAQGQITLCYIIIAYPQYCATTKVGQPKLAIQKTGPARALLNQQVTYNIVVKNIGTAVAKNVVITDRVPDGLRHASGQAVLKMPVGDLAPNQSASKTVTFTTTRRGRVVNVAVANASNASPVQDDAPTIIEVRSLKLNVTCRKEMYIGKRLQSKMLLENPGDTALTNVVITAELGDGVLPIRADGPATKSGNQFVWNIPTLKPGAKLAYNFVAISRAPGEKCVTVRVTCNEGITKTDRCCTMWKGLPALLLEVIDTVDPLLPNEYTTYEISITNQGTARDTNVQIKAFFPMEITPEQATGDSAGTISGKNVVFQPYPVLEPKQKIKFVIKAKAVKLGDSRLKVKMYSDLLETPVNEEESTHVY